MSGLGALMPAGTPFGGGLLARQTAKSVALVASQGAVVQAKNDAAAMATFAAIQNVQTLTAAAVQAVEANPASATYIEPLLQGYSSIAARQIAKEFQ